MKARQRGLMSALQAGNLNRVMSFYARSYRHREGATRRDLQAVLGRYFGRYTIERMDLLKEDYSANAAGTQVKQTLRLRIVQRDRETGKKESLEAVAAAVWSRQAGAWVLIREQDGEVARSSTPFAERS